MFISIKTVRISRFIWQRVLDCWASVIKSLTAVRAKSIARNSETIQVSGSKKKTARSSIEVKACKSGDIANVWSFISGFRAALRPMFFYCELQRHSRRILKPLSSTTLCVLTQWRQTLNLIMTLQHSINWRRNAKHRSRFFESGKHHARTTAQSEKRLYKTNSNNVDQQRLMGCVKLGVTMTKSCLRRWIGFGWEHSGVCGSRYPPRPPNGSVESIT